MGAGESAVAVIVAVAAAILLTVDAGYRRVRLT